MKFAVDLTKGVLGSNDPVNLWEDITGYIPDSVLLDPNVRILSIACGHCTEAIVLAKRMLALGISKSSVQDSIWLLDKYHQFTNQAIVKYGFKNTITEDFLTWETKMKFDVVVGNPPYQDPTGQNTLYPWFYSKAVSVTKDDGYIAMITPPAIIPGLWGLKDPDGIKMPEPLEINKIAVGNCVKDFFPGIASEFCYFILKNVKGSTNSQVCIKTDAGEIIANGPLFPKVIDSGSLTIAQSILNKCFVFYKDPYSATSGDHGKSARFDPAGQDLAVEAISTTGDLRTRPITWNKKHDHYNKPKVILPMYGKVAVIDYSHKLVSAAQEKTANGKLTGHNIMTVLTANDGESESLVQLLGSRLQRFFNTVTGETRAPYVNFLKNFIGVPLSTKYTDDDLETVLGLTPEEKEWISVNF